MIVTKTFIASDHIIVTVEEHNVLTGKWDLLAEKIIYKGDFE
jgi:hypothetical protein